MSTEGKLEVKEKQDIAAELDIRPEAEVVASEGDSKLAEQADRPDLERLG